MGACQFYNTGIGKSARDVFTRLQENAEREYGDDCYNGTISTVPGFRDITNEWKASKKTLDSFIDAKLNDANKYDCFCICTHQPVTNNNKIKSHVEHIVEKGTKKWVLRYVVHDRFGDKCIGEFITKGDAVKAARKYTESSLRSSEITMVRMLEKGSAVVAKIEYKKSTTEKDGQWVFFGYAAE